MNLSTKFINFGLFLADPSVHYIFYDYFEFRPDSHYGLPFQINIFQCTSRETQITQCNYTQFDIYSLWEISGIKCQTSKTSESNFHLLCHALVQAWVVSHAYHMCMGDDYI